MKKRKKCAKQKHIVWSFTKEKKMKNYDLKLSRALEARGKNTFYKRTHTQKYAQSHATEQ